ncbi:hypothetical protein K1T71_011484 [Dendrolimus kikuchii]|uniref:Uncharacterized protein n=1 Tax=Dendrolimus kikuchii TaxID=765133 RepID=A0ACC1CP61_9NEOP|nr:hypothetical protein K1T71_011484 [Dendrolimus kikuchii]
MICIKKVPILERRKRMPPREYIVAQPPVRVGQPRAPPPPPPGRLQRPPHDNPTVYLRPNTAPRNNVNIVNRS